MPQFWPNPRQRVRAKKAKNHHALNVAKIERKNAVKQHGCYFPILYSNENQFEGNLWQTFVNWSSLKQAFTQIVRTPCTSLYITISTTHNCRLHIPVILITMARWLGWESICKVIKRKFKFQIYFEANWSETQCDSESLALSILSRDRATTNRWVCGTFCERRRRFQIARKRPWTQPIGG